VFAFKLLSNPKLPTEVCEVCAGTFVVRPALWKAEEIYLRLETRAPFRCFFRLLSNPKLLTEVRSVCASTFVVRPALWKAIPIYLRLETSAPFRRFSRLLSNPKLSEICLRQYLRCKAGSLESHFNQLRAGVPRPQECPTLRGALPSFFRFFSPLSTPASSTGGSLRAGLRPATTGGTRHLADLLTTYGWMGDMCLKFQNSLCSLYQC